MPEPAITSLKTYFADLRDPRAQRSIEHLLIDIVMLTICAVICGAESWVEIEHYGVAKQGWLATFLELPHGIPSHDTLERVFARLRPEPIAAVLSHLGTGNVRDQWWKADCGGWKNAARQL